MSETCETVKVKSPVSEDNPTGYILINKSDFNDSHELIDAEEPEGAKKATVAELKEALTAKGIEIPEGAKKADLQMLLDKSE